MLSDKWVWKAVETPVNHFRTHPRTQVEMVLLATHFRRFAKHQKMVMGSHTIAWWIVAGNSREVRSNYRFELISTKSVCSTTGKQQLIFMQASAKRQQSKKSGFLPQIPRSSTRLPLRAHQQPAVRRRHARHVAKLSFLDLVDPRTLNSTNPMA